MFDTSGPYSEQLSLKIELCSINREAVVLNAHWRYIFMRIKILNIKDENLKHEKPVSEGNYATAFHG